MYTWECRVQGRTVHSRPSLAWVRVCGTQTPAQSIQFDLPFQGIHPQPPSPPTPRLTHQRQPSCLCPNDSERGQSAWLATRKTILYCREKFSLSEISACYLQQLMFSLALSVCMCVMKKVWPKENTGRPCRLPGLGALHQDLKLALHWKGSKTYISTHTHMHTHTYAHMHTHVCVHAHVRTRTHIPGYYCVANI